MDILGTEVTLEEIFAFLKERGGCYDPIMPYHYKRITYCFNNNKVFVEKVDGKIVQFVAWLMVKESDIERLINNVMPETIIGGDIIYSLDYALEASPKSYSRLINTLALQGEPQAKGLCFHHAHGANTGKFMMYDRVNSETRPWRRRKCAVAEH